MSLIPDPFDLPLVETFSRHSAPAAIQELRSLKYRSVTDGSTA
jgi:hypothetical protein